MSWAQPNTVVIALPEVPGVMYRNEQGQPSGFPVELIAHAAHDEGYDVLWIDGDWPSLLDAAMGGSVDVLPGAIQTPERERSLIFPERPLHIMWGELYLLAETPFTGINQLNGQRIGLVKGDVSAQGFDEFIAGFAIDFTRVELPSHQVGIDQLKAATIDALVGPATLRGRTDAILSSGLFFAPRRWSIAFSKTLPSQVRLALERRLAHYMDTPGSVYFQLYEKYGLADMRHADDSLPTWVAWLLLALCLVGALSWVFIALLGRQVRRQVQQITHEQRRFELIFESIIDAIVIVDTDDGRVSMANPAARQLFQRDTLQGALIEDLIKPTFAGQSLDNILSQSQGDQMFQFEWICQQTDCFIDISYRQVSLDQKTRSALFVMRDISQRKANEAELQRRGELIERSRRVDAIAQMVSGITHDFRNLVGAILGAAELLEMSFAQIDDESQEHIETIKEASIRAGSITRQLLNFGRDSASKFVLVNAFDTIQAAIRILRRSIDAKISIDFDCRAKNFNVSGDYAQLMNVLINMGLNAAHAMPGGGSLRFVLSEIELEPLYCKISANDLTPGWYLRITIEDTGTGIATEHLEAIFDPFFTTKSADQGTGLGLSAALAIMRQHRGGIRVFSELERGTVFQLDLPQCDLVHHEADKDFSFSGTVLVIDDESDFRVVAEVMLANMGMNVLLAENGVAGLELFSARYSEIDLILLDCIMPGIHGLHIRQEMQRLFGETCPPIIMCSTFEQDSELLQAHFGSQQAFLRKPYGYRDLGHMVSQMLTSSPA